MEEMYKRVGRRCEVAVVSRLKQYCKRMQCNTAKKVVSEALAVNEWPPAAMNNER